MKKKSCSKITRQTCTLPEDSCFSVFLDFYVYYKFCMNDKHTHTHSKQYIGVFFFNKNRIDIYNS